VDEVLQEKKNVDETLKLPMGATTNVQLERLARRMRISFFRGVFMRDALPIDGVYENESGIVNLDNTEGPGTHWVAYARRGNRSVYFDSFGNLRPPRELTRYLEKNGTTIQYNRTPYQRYNQSNCGQLCLRFLQTVDNQFKDRHFAI
jgi:hypothetical protein